MIPGLTPVLLGGLASVLFLLLLAAYSLRDFSRSRLDEICRRRDNRQLFGDVLKNHETVLLAVEFLVICCTIVLVWFGIGWLLQQLAEPVGWLGITTLVVEVLFTTVLVLFGAYLLPWSIARAWGELYLVRCWPVLRLLKVLCTPLLAVAARLDRIAHRLAGLPEPNGNTPDSITEEILSVVDEGQREGVLENNAGTMIHRVMELRDEDVAAVMTPRTDMHVIPAETSLEEARVQLLEFGHSRVPVVGSSIDDLVGILYAKDLLQHFQSHENNGAAVSLRDIVRQPMYVPESMHIDQLLEHMKRDHVHLAIVIDEYSSVVGLVTMEDVLEEIVGSITDEYDPEEEDGIHPVSADVIEVDSWVHIDELNEKFGLELPEDGDYETVAGFVFDELGRVPSERESLKRGQLTVTVLKADERRIHKLRIEIDRTLAAAGTEEG